MIKSLRKSTKVVIWIVVVSFALCGGYSFSTSFFNKRANYAGEVFGKMVTFQEFDRFYRANQLFSFRRDISKDPELMRYFTWESIIMAREAKRQKIQVSDEEIAQQIMRMLQAQGVEKPTTEIYQRWLVQSLREKPRDFEEKLREFIRIQKLIQRVNPPVQPPAEEEVRRFFFLDQNMVAVKMLRFPTLEEAKAFVEKGRRDGAWKVEFEKEGKTVTSIPMTGIGKLAYGLQASEKDVQALHSLEPGSLSDPMASGPEFAVFYLLDKKNVSDSDFNEAAKKESAQKLAEQKQSLNFLKWRMDLMNRAKLSDFNQTPSAPPDSE